MWIELGQGSLIVTMDVGATGPGEWPEDHERTTSTRSAMAGNVADRIARRQGATNRRPGEQDPWQPSHGDQEPGARPEIEGSRLTHAPTGSRLALVSEKNINLTRFLGTQHKENKISYTKWKR